MKRKGFRWALGIVAVSAIAAGCARAQAQDDPSPLHFNGVINDYSPVTTSSTKPPVGPWEVRGPWSLDLQGRSGKANFYAAVTMETSDYGIAESIVDPATPASRSPHTHHISMIGASVIENPTDCPATAPSTPSYTPRLEITGPADVSGNGGSPFGAGVLSPLTVCIDGGPDIQFSNITLEFKPPAGNHFGQQPIRGVVTKMN